MRIVCIYGRRWWWLRRLLGLRWVRSVALVCRKGHCYVVKDGMVVVDELPFEFPSMELYVETDIDPAQYLFAIMDQESLLATLVDGKWRPLEETVDLIERIYEPTKGY